MRWRYGVAAVLLAFVIFCGYILGGSLLSAPSDASRVSVTDIDAATTFWREQVRLVGGAHAYQSFRTWASNGDINQQHTLAHVMGGILYNMLGKEGLSVCDSSFSFGCFHEFLGRAIHEEGLSVVYELNDACFTNLGAQSLSCQHGIGHGVQTFFGYDDSALREALAQCDKLPFSDPIGGCYGGVFMEYNMRTMLSLDGVGPRDNTDPEYPCSTLKDPYLPACYYWQPQWWVATSDIPQMETYTVMGGRCMQAGTPYLEQKCFEGIGNISGQTVQYEPVRTIALCEASSLGDTEAELYCRADAANSYFVIPSARARASEVCEGLIDSDYEYCRKFSDNTFNQVEHPSRNE